MGYFFDKQAVSCLLQVTVHKSTRSTHHVYRRRDKLNEGCTESKKMVFVFVTVCLLLELYVSEYRE